MSGVYNLSRFWIVLDGEACIFVSDNKSEAEEVASVSEYWRLIECSGEEI